MKPPLPFEQVVATAMLLGEPAPTKCNICNGRGVFRSVIGFARCYACDGRGALGATDKVWDALGLLDNK